MHMVFVSGKCQSDQQSLLLQMKNSLVFDSSLSTHLVQWSPSTDCCAWIGVDCDLEGHVIGLNLCNESITGGIENATGLFGLQYLRSLNLALNDFHFTQIPSRLGNLTNLTYLNLSTSGFEGQIPYAISGMTRLITLDFSNAHTLEFYFSNRNLLKLEKPNLSVLVQNLTELRELYLDGVNISASGNEWCQALSPSLPNLQVLSLCSCFLSGPIDSSLANMRSLSKIHLEDNDMSSPIPEFLADYVNLTSLRLSACGLHGKFPEKILKVPTLETLDLSHNLLLEGFLPDHFPKNASLRTLILGNTMFSGALPESIGNLRNLSTLDLSMSNFCGSIPTSMAYLTQLVDLYLSGNALTGAISFIGWEELLNLDHIDLSGNLLIGRIPPSLFALPSMRVLNLSNNQFDGQLPKFSSASSLVLETLDLSNNILEGHIPMSVFELKSLYCLIISFNNLNGTVQLDWLGNLVDLQKLDLSYNKLTVNVSSSSLPMNSVSELKLASCNLSIFPNLKVKSIDVLDLSNNKLSGEIPNWIWEKTVLSLNLSYNLLVGLQEPYSNISQNLECLDLHSNLLQGKIPLISSWLFYVDYSSNLFSSFPADIGNFLLVTRFFSLSNNKLKGVIPKSLCKVSKVGDLQVLDLSSNNLSGRIPRCLIRRSKTLGILNLERNNLSGFISNKFPANCTLQSLSLNGNHLEGILPKSLAHCKMLEVVDIGSNHIIDQFPCWLKNVSSLRILVLRSNRFYGEVGCLEINGSWPLLQIIDLSFNTFSGRLPQKGLTNWKPMIMEHEDKAQSQLKNLGFQYRTNLILNKLKSADTYYHFTVTITYKDFQRELMKILTIFTSIDFSCNYFEGSIPEEIGLLKSLHILNLSYNALTGQIPSSIGNLKDLESFDLSFNNLSGVIPPEFASLNFLSLLNLSYNHLVGKIPLSTQLQSFSPTSFIGNQGLCGPPLTNNCTNPFKLPIRVSSKEIESKEIDWRFVLMAIGFVIGFGVTVTPLMFCKKVNKWYDDRIDNFFK